MRKKKYYDFSNRIDLDLVIRHSWPLRKNHTVEILLASKSNKLQMAKGLMGSTQDQCSFLGK